MDNILNIIISLISGALAGGITSYKLVSKQIQKSKGKNSPNIGGGVSGTHFGDNGK